MKKLSNCGKMKKTVRNLILIYQSETDVCSAATATRVSRLLRGQQSVLTRARTNPADLKFRPIPR